jgi:hypothetical protein
MLIEKEKTLSVAAAKAGMDEKTARRYLRAGRLPSQIKKPHIWRTRDDPFEGVWEELKEFLGLNAGLEAKTLFEHLQHKYGGCFPDGQLRTLQRRVKRWRALEGPSKETYFPQCHRPGELCEADFTSMNSLGVTIQGQRFDHLLYHFVLTYSNWETGSVCFSESFESLSEGLQSALWKLGGVPKELRMDRLSAAVHKECNPEEFTPRYQALLRHYGLKGSKIQRGEAHENGDIEQRHYRIKRALDQALMLRGSLDFSSRVEYEAFLQKVFNQLDSGRRERFSEELGHLRRLPERRLDDCRWLKVKVGPASSISVCNNVYSVSSRLIGERVSVRLYAEHLEVWYGQRRVESIPRLRGERRHRIQYRHIIEWLVRKPGAFENYRYRDDLFPTTRFRMAYDFLKRKSPTQAAKIYLEILYLAARESETGADEALRMLLKEGQMISVEAVRKILGSNLPAQSIRDVEVQEIDLGNYDELLSSRKTQEVGCGTNTVTIRSKGDGGAKNISRLKVDKKETRG